MDFKEFAEVMQKVQNGEISFVPCPLCNENIKLGYDGGWYVRCLRKGCIYEAEPKRKFPSAEEAAENWRANSELILESRNFARSIIRKMREVVEEMSEEKTITIAVEQDRGEKQESTPKNGSLYYFSENDEWFVRNSDTWEPIQKDYHCKIHGEIEYDKTITFGVDTFCQQCIFDFLKKHIGTLTRETKR